MIAYRALLDVPRELIVFLSRLLAVQRRERGTRAGTRALTCFKQALFALVWFRERWGIPLIGTGFGLSQATSYRYLHEVIDVAASAPGLPEALARVRGESWSYVVLDGKVIVSDRLRIKTISKKGTIIDAWYSGKTHGFVGNIQAVTRPDRFPAWVSDVEPGSTHDLTAARVHVLGVLYAGRSRAWPTQRMQGAGQGVHIPVKQSADGGELDIDTRTRDMLLRPLCCLGEQGGFALLTGRWRTLRHVTLSPSKIGEIAQAALILTHFEHGYLNLLRKNHRNLTSTFSQAWFIARPPALAGGLAIPGG